MKGSERILIPSGRDRHRTRHCGADRRGATGRDDQGGCPSGSEAAPERGELPGTGLCLPRLELRGYLALDEDARREVAGFVEQAGPDIRLASVLFARL